MKTLAEDKDIDELYRRTNNHENRLVQIETAQPYLKDILERSVATGEKLAKTMQDVQMTMISLDAEMKSMKEEFTVAHKQTNEEIAQVNEKVARIEEKGKFDIWAFVNKYLPWIIVLLGVGIYGVSSYVKF